MQLACFDLLDRHVVGGHADDVALRTPTTSWSYARLLEEVSAFGGVLRHCGVGPGDRVAVALAEGVEGVVAVLATARIGARWRPAASADGAVVLVAASTETEVLRRTGAAVVLVRQHPGEEWVLREGRDYDWEVVMRAGRTDPAPLVEGAVLEADGAVAHWAERLHVRETVALPA